LADPTTRTVAEIATERGFWECGSLFSVASRKLFALAWILRALLDAVDRSGLAFILFLIVSAVLVVVYTVTFALMW